MKTKLTFLFLWVLTSFANATPPAVGSISENQPFARASESSPGFNATDLNAQEGRILILMMMTPWCPICQSNAQGVGSGLLAHFNNPTRGALRGKNDNGVPIESILLSTEESDAWDAVNTSFSTKNGFDHWGLDADTQRQNPRRLLGYFRGGFINSSDLYDWGNDRRRLVVLNLVKGSASHAFREIVINTNSYSSINDTAARAAINGIIQGTSEEPEPEIEVYQPANRVLVDGKASRNFGRAKTGSRGKSLSFRVTNTGDSALSGLILTKAGPHSRDFIISRPPVTRLAPGKSTVFKVDFRPSGPGARRARLMLGSNDRDESPFDMTVAGIGAR